MHRWRIIKKMNKNVQGEWSTRAANSSQAIELTTWGSLSSLFPLSKSHPVNQKMKK
jgi:hypothetical protein